MRFFAGQAETAAAEIVRALLSAKDIDADSPREVEADVAAVLRQYAADERAVGERAKDLVESHGRPRTDLNRLKRLEAEKRGIKIGDEALDYILDQIVLQFHQSPNVDEIFVEDVELRRKMAIVLKKFGNADAEVDTLVRAQLRHMQEGTRDWEIEYARVSEQVRRRKGLL